MTPAEVIHALYEYRCALYDSRQRGYGHPAFPELSPQELVDAYGWRMNMYGQGYLTFVEWWELQQAPQGPRVFKVVGG